MSNAALKNTGIHILSAPANTHEKTIIVLGIARGGTSLVAGALAKLGVFMGEHAVDPVYEDSLLSQYFENNDTASLTRTIETYNQAYSIWGFKRPSLVNYLDLAHNSFRNPHYICIFKDIFSIANRNKISMKEDLLSNMDKSLSEYQSIISFLEQTKPPAVLISYEKALQNKEELIETLVKFCNFQVTNHQLSSAADFITPNPHNYITQTRSGQIIGHLDTVERNVITGWAAVSADKNPKPLKVSLTINNIPIATCMADKPRLDLVAHKVHKTGNAGFQFNLDKTNELNSGDLVRVHEESSSIELTGSPIPFED